MSSLFGFSTSSRPQLGSTASLYSLLPDSKHTLITFLGAAQLLSVDLLPITYNSALVDAGVGGTATLRERLISRNLSLLFKRIHPRHFPQYPAKIAEGIVFRTLTAEITTARHYNVVRSKYLAHLEGVSWDIESDGKVWPVLVYEKAKYGSIRTASENPELMTSIELNLKMKLQICFHVAKGLVTLHSNGIFDAGTEDYG